MKQKQQTTSNNPVKEYSEDFKKWAQDNYREIKLYGYYLPLDCDYPLLSIEEIEEKYNKLFPPLVNEGQQEGKHTPDLKYSPHYKGEPAGHLWSNKEDRMICHLSTVAAGTQEQLNKDAARIVKVWNEFYEMQADRDHFQKGYDDVIKKAAALLEENEQLKAENEKLKKEAKKNQREWAEMIVDLDCRSKENEQLKEANRELLDLISECYGDYSHPHFTDRHGMADRLKSAIAKHSK